MDREDDIIELGIATVETQVPGLHPGDDFIGLVATGLSDD